MNMLLFAKIRSLTNKLISSTGIETNLSYLPDATTNYLKTVNSLKAADKALDSKVKVIDDGLTAATTNVNFASIKIAGTTVIDSTGKWVGDNTDLQGIQGIQGIRGIQGITGTGTQGTTGSQGTQGITGIKGTDGTSVALKGSVNLYSELAAITPKVVGDLYIVITANVSPVYAAGDGALWNGTTWVNVGPIRGVQGTTGSQGTQGIQGIQGHQGITGAQGIKGTDGTIGSNGTQGTQGIQGIQGRQGITGIGTQGTTGSQGIQGPIGPSTQINATEDTAAAAIYPVMIASAGTNVSAKITSSKFAFNAATGYLTATGGFSAGSDARLKHNIESLDGTRCLDIVSKLNPVSFNWNDSNNPSFGLIAQELELIMPEIVKDGAEFKSVDYSAIIPILIKAVQELINK